MVFMQSYYLPFHVNLGRNNYHAHCLIPEIHSADTKTDKYQVILLMLIESKNVGEAASPLQALHNKTKRNICQVNHLPTMK